MKLRIVSLFTVLVFALGTMGCASISRETGQNPGASTGAAVGAVGGAIAGSLMGAHGARTETAIIGGILGAVAGGLVGHYAYDVKRSRAETDRRYNYQPSEGISLRMEGVNVDPRVARPGEEVRLLATYAIMTPSAQDAVQVREIREIRLGNQLVGKPEVKVTRGGGTYTSKIPLMLPQDARPGRYKVYTTIETPNASDTRETTFEVR